jgi:hypothetical protein
MNSNIDELYKWKSTDAQHEYVGFRIALVPVGWSNHYCWICVFILFNI